mgnify:CR=1 FL=1
MQQAAEGCVALVAAHYEAEHGALPEAVSTSLLAASASTLDRLLKAFRVAHPKGLCGTKPGTLLNKQIPIRCEHWDVSIPGFVEADTVAHCGNSLAGDFVWSLTMTDILTGRTECRATWNKGAQGVITQIKAIEAALPFPLKGFDCDNGSEFLNHHLVRYFSGHPDQPSFSRSRPYRKNDNAHVEQKNWSQVRHLFGYDRFDNPRLVDLMNDLYANEWSQLQNHFCPPLKLKEKSREGTRTERKTSCIATSHFDLHRLKCVIAESDPPFDPPLCLPPLFIFDYFPASRLMEHVPELPIIPWGRGDRGAERSISLLSVTLYLIQLNFLPTAFGYIFSEPIRPRKGSCHGLELQCGKAILREEEDKEGF